MKVKDSLLIYYVAVREHDDVQGAVQRVLNKRRINSIKEFVLAGNTIEITGNYNGNGDV